MSCLSPLELVQNNLNAYGWSIFKLSVEDSITRCFLPNYSCRRTDLRRRINALAEDLRFSSPSSHPAGRISIVSITQEKISTCFQKIIASKERSTQVHSELERLIDEVNKINALYTVHFTAKFTWGIHPRLFFDYGFLENILKNHVLQAMAKEIGSSEEISACIPERIKTLCRVEEMSLSHHREMLLL